MILEVEEKLYVNCLGKLQVRLFGIYIVLYLYVTNINSRITIFEYDE